MTARKKKEPVHRIFYLCSTFTDDIAWSDFLKDCSFGKFPRGIRYEDGAIKCSRKKQTFIEYIPKDTEKALEVILSIFRDKLNIKTSKEKQTATAKFDKKREAAKIKTWRQATTMATKTSLIRTFAEKFADQYFLSVVEHKELLVLLNIGLSTKMINADHIEMIDGQIIGIKGLNFDYGTRTISLNGAPKVSSPIPYSIPLEFVPKSQQNYDLHFANVLEYHVNKMPKREPDELHSNLVNIIRQNAQEDLANVLLATLTGNENQNNQQNQQNQSHDAIKSEADDENDDSDSCDDDDEN